MEETAWGSVAKWLEQGNGWKLGSTALPSIHWPENQHYARVGSPIAATDQQ